MQYLGNTKTYFPNSFPEYRTGRGTMKINGIADLKVKPDTAIISISIISENVNLQAAIQENSITSANVLNSLYKLGISKDDIYTDVYNIEPQYDFIEGKQTFRNYKVTDTINVKTKDLSSVGEIIDTSIAAGANAINSVKFTLENQTYYYNKALNMAIKNAILKAEQISGNLKIWITPIPVQIKELSSIQAAEYFTQTKNLTFAPPIIPGKINITAQVEAIFCY